MFAPAGLARIFACLAGLLLAFPSQGAESRREVQIVKDADFFGFDLRSEQNVTLDQCKASCIADKTCKAFTFNPKVNWCFLKSDFKTMNAFPGAIAGKIVEKAGKAEADLGAPARPAFISADLLQQARSAKNDLRLDDAHKNEPLDSLTANARLSAADNDIPASLAYFNSALSLSPDDAALWLEMSRVAASFAKTDANDGAEIYAQAVKAALNGFELTRTASQRAEALAVLAGALEKAGNYRAALQSYKASLALTPSKQVESAFLALRQSQGFRITGHSIDNDSATPRACVTLSEPLVKTVDYTPFVTLDGAPPKALEAKDRQICVENLKHGQSYKLVFRKGLPSSVEEVLEAPVALDIYVKDRTASLRFTGDNFVLPSTARHGIPMVSVNLASADLKLYRIGERGIAPLLTGSQFLTQLDGYSAGRIEADQGELVWQGSIDLASELNKDTVTSFPVDEALAERKPGIYVLTATPPNQSAQSWDSQATQWFLVSDIGIVTYAGSDGLHVFARSLASAEPLADIDLQLIARNNEVLGTARTDGEGRAVFTAGLIRGSAAQAPSVIAAKNGKGDYVFLDLTRAGFDLSDRGVAGRAAPGAIDILAWTERGIYRAGETVHAAALSRDIEGNAIGAMPLTFIFMRPDGVEDRRIVSAGASLGGHAVDFSTDANAMRGTWTVNIHVDPKASPLASKSFLVDDFVPDRTELSLSTEAKSIGTDQPATIAISGKYLYGAPAAGLTLEGDVAVKPVRDNPAYPGYVFGLADEEAGENERQIIEGLPALDEEGKAETDLTIGEVPATSQLLNATVSIRMQEAGGRAVERALTLPVRQVGDKLGIKPEFSGSVAENSTASFTVIAVSADGERIEKKGLRWKLFSLERDYQWYREGSAWKYEPIYNPRQIADGSLDIGRDGGKIATAVGWGRYRLEVESLEAEGPVSSVEFDAGWFVEAKSSETPDGLEVALDKPSYRIGETAKLKIASRYAGKVLVTVGSETLASATEADIGAEGGEIALPVTEAFGAGSYVTATLFRPGNDQDSHMPMRAIGIKWLAVDPGERKLRVAIDAPDKTIPRAPLDLKLKVQGAGVGEEAYVMVAAVDVGILNLTRYEAPDPEAWYFGQRQLGLEIRDLYGRLIDGLLGALGRIRTGGDGGSVALQGSPPKEKLVAFFSGPVKLDAEGNAAVRFDIPQFNGTARVMAVAWSKSGLGHAVRDVVIRDPLVVTASLPKFLAPGDKADLRLDIVNTDGPAGDYALTASGSDGVGLDAHVQTFALPIGGKTAMTLTLAGRSIGEGKVQLALQGPEGVSLSQTLDLPVRPAAMPLTERRVVEVKPGAALRIDQALLANSTLQGASLSVSVTRSAAFDIPALLMVLDRYPLGCAEQTTSRALPLLYYTELARQAGLPDDPDIRQRVQDGIYRLMSYQSSSGSFGLWGPDSGDLWLDAYVTDFLTRAREKDYDVPARALSQALDNLQNALSYDVDVKQQGNQIAYALYVLARNRKAAISDLRYYADTQLNAFPTPLAKAHLAAALSLYGDATRSKTIFIDALQMSSTAVATPVSLARSDYGSSLRDAAAILALAAEARPVPPILPELAKLTASQWQRKTYTSTQEQAWMLLAARALSGGDDGVAVEVNGALHQKTYSARMTGDALIQSPLTLVNRGSDPVSAVVTTVAAPATPLPAGGEGFTIERSYYTLSGEPATISQARQNERYVVVLKVTEKNNWDQRIVITDLLPAGLEIDNPSIVDSAKLTNFDWIGEVTPAHVEFRSDRFVAAFNEPEGENKELTLAYVVRAVTPGRFEHPAASVEDMYRPQFQARTATGKMEVLGATP